MSRLGERMNADYNAVRRTADRQLADATPTAREQIDAVGPVVDTVLCPLCRTETDLVDSGVRVEGRCPGCTVRVRLIDGRVKDAGWMFGGDMKAAGAAVAKLRSRLETGGPMPLRAGPTCGDKIGTTAGFYRHRSHCEKPCDDCAEAYRVYHRARERGRNAAKRAAQDELRPCGTDAAYQAHLRRGEKPCDPCREAHTRMVDLRAKARRKKRKKEEAA